MSPGNPGRGKITVRTSVEAGTVVIATDTGGGIPEHVRRIFISFTNKEVGCGTGQGLPLPATLLSKVTVASSTSERHLRRHDARRRLPVCGNW
jgi:C4-dicarboxylate-specific signal transduction histidine kinase